MIHAARNNAITPTISINSNTDVHLHPTTATIQSIKRHFQHLVSTENNISAPFKENALSIYRKQQKWQERPECKTFSAKHEALSVHTHLWVDQPHPDHPPWLDPAACDRHGSSYWHPLHAGKATEQLDERQGLVWITTARCESTLSKSESGDRGLVGHSPLIHPCLDRTHCVTGEEEVMTDSKMKKWLERLQYKTWVTFIKIKWQHISHISYL